MGAVAEVLYHAVLNKQVTAFVALAVAPFCEQRRRDGRQRHIAVECPARMIAIGFEAVIASASGAIKLIFRPMTCGMWISFDENRHQ